MIDTLELRQKYAIRRDGRRSTRPAGGMDVLALCDEVDRLKAELAVTDNLLEERNRLLEAIPQCPLHGECIPHAIEWVERMKSAQEEAEFCVGFLRACGQKDIKAERERLNRQAQIEESQMEGFGDVEGEE